jgi:integrase
LRNVFNVARDEWKWMKHSPFAGAKMPVENQPRQTTWGWREIRKVLRAPRVGKTAEMQKAFHLALRTGMRLAEVLQSPTLYDADKKVVTLKTKTEQVGRVPIGRIAHKMLINQPSFVVDANEGSVLFSKLCRELLIKGLTFHDTRATALTHLAKKVPVEVLAKISRHKDISLLVNVYYRPKASDISKLI